MGSADLLCVSTMGGTLEFMASRERGREGKKLFLFPKLSTVCSAQRAWVDDRVCLCVCLLLGDSFFARARGKGLSSTTGSVWSREKGTGAGMIGH